MTVEEAIKKLEMMPPKSKLLRGDNSGGYEEVYEIESEEVTDNFSKEKHQAVVVA